MTTQTDLDTAVKVVAKKLLGVTVDYEGSFEPSVWMDSTVYPLRWLYETYEGMGAILEALDKHGDAYQLHSYNRLPENRVTIWKNGGGMSYAKADILSHAVLLAAYEAVKGE
mgnify:CR=1 FL=1